MVEREYGITEFVSMRGDDAFFGRVRHNDEQKKGESWTEPRLTREQAKWLRIFPEHARPCYGSDYFVGLDDDLKVDVVEGLSLRVKL